MNARRRKAAPSRSLPVEQPQPTRRPRHYARWRAATLATVYLLFGLHIAHWKIAGKTLAPLELNEVMYTLELGIVTAGFLFMAAALLSAAIFGRFFCSWGCHILALEDLCAWLLRKLRIRPKPIRSRVLLLVPPAAMFYMFLWPQVSRLLEGRPLPQVRILSDAQGWASFVTEDYWRNLPGPWITGLTFALCGFAIVYALGTRSFCTYGCPYGVAFRFMDRFSPGRIRLSGECDGCALCTAGCQSQVRVHEEVLKYGKVVNPNCLKDLDCIAVCPLNGLDYGFAKPAPRLSWRHFRRPFDFTLAEDALMAAAFVATLLAFRGLYDAVPFLMTLGLGAVVAYVAVLCLRLVRQPLVRLNNFLLKRGGRLTRSGVAFAGLCTAFGLFFAHSAFIRWHEFRGQRDFNAIQQSLERSGDAPDALVQAAIGHWKTCERWGLFHSVHLDRRLASLYRVADVLPQAEAYYRRVLARKPDDLQSRLEYGQVLLAQQRLEEARHELERVAHSTDVVRARPAAQVRGHAFELLGRLAASQGDSAGAMAAYQAALREHPDSVLAHLALAELCTNATSYSEATEHLRAALAIQPDQPAVRYNLAVLLAQQGREAEAVQQYEAALRLAPHDAEIHNNLGFLLARLGDTRPAAVHFRRAIELKPDYAHPYFNLARILLAEGKTAEGVACLERAAALDATYAELLRNFTAQDGAGATGSP